MSGFDFSRRYALIVCTALTDWGRELVSLYRQVEAESQAANTDALARLEAMLGTGEA